MAIRQPILVDGPVVGEVKRQLVCSLSHDMPPWVLASDGPSIVPSLCVFPWVFGAQALGAVPPSVGESEDKSFVMLLEG